MGQVQTAEGVLSQVNPIKSKVAIVTGSSSGIGLETARVLAKGGIRVIMACRGKEKTEKVIEQIRKSLNNVKDAGSVEFLELDLNDLDNVRAFANKFLAFNIPLHYLVLNAGVLDVTFRKTKQGHEGAFGTNHLAHFLLTTLLLDLLKASAPARVVVLSSSAHANAPIFWEDFLSEGKNWNIAQSYGQSKMANLLFAMELDRRLAQDAKDSKDRVIAVSLHPGFIKTELHRGFPVLRGLFTLAQPFIKNIPQGAATTVHCCLASNIEGGKYYADCAVAPVYPNSSCIPLDKAATRLWEASEKLVNTVPDINESKDKKEEQTKEKEIEKEIEKEKQDVIDFVSKDKEIETNQKQENTDA